MHIAQLQADIACNKVLEPRLHQITTDVEAKGPAEFSSLVERFKTNPSPEKPPTNAPQQKTYDEMLLALMLKVWEEAKKDGVEKDDPQLGEALVKGLQKHIEELEKHQEKLKQELVQEEAEQKKKITSDDIHEGWESHVSAGPRHLVVQSLTTGQPVRACEACPATYQERHRKRIWLKDDNYRDRGSEPQRRGCRAG